MADNTIDTLSLEIESNSNGADKAIERLANSLLKLESSLSSINFGQFANISSGISQMATSMTHFSQTVKTADFTRIATGLNKLAGVNVQGVADASRAINTLTANLSQIGTISFDSQEIANMANAIGMLGRKTITQATQNVPQLTMALSGLVTSMNNLKAVSFDVSSLSNLAASITKLGGKSATNAIPNIKNLGVALDGMMKTLSKSPAVSQNLIQMTQALANLASNGNRVSSASSGLINGLNGIGSSASKAKKHTVSLAAAFGKFYATYWLILRGLGAFRKAIDISSDLTEVQNVVDVTFGDMKDKVEDLASTSIKDFGMSELTAKQISSRFQAMGMAMGFAQDRMSDMSIQLTELAADMASFYNVEQSEVAESLSAIFTGQTRPLRRFGLDLTQATLQEWALKEGIDANVQSMSQMEKTMLRFQYVMANSKYVIGDYARTADTWHNSMVRLGQQFEQLAIIVGNVLINTFKPFIAGLNRMMEGVVAFAQTVANALGKIFGWTIEIGSGGIANDFEDAGIGAEEMADGTGAAKDNLKEMQKYIAAWHELNNMTTKDDTGKGGGGAGGGLGGGLGDAAGAQLVQTENLFDKYKSEIDSLYELGAYIGETLTRAMDSIDWDKVYERARNFGKGLADFLNGLISPELFGAVGRTIAGALNAAIYSALTFGQTFDWKNLGLSIASGINNFFQTFDFSSLAETINVWAKGLLDTAITAIDNTDWGLIGKRIGDFLAEIDFLEIAGKVMKALWKSLNSAFATYEGLFERAPFETAILSLVGITKLLKVDKIKKFLSVLKDGIMVVTSFGKALNGNVEAIAFLSAKFPKLSKLVKVCGESFSYLVYGMRTMESGGLLTGLSAGFNHIQENLTGMQKGLIGVTAGFAEFSIVRDSIKDIVNGTGNLATNILELAGAAGIAGVALSTVFGFPAGLIAAGVIGLVSAFVGIKDAINDIEAEAAMNTVGNALKNPGGTPLDEITSAYQDMVSSISDGFDKINQKASELNQTKEHARETSESIDLIKFAIDNGSTVAEEKIPELTQLFNSLLSDSKSIFEEEYDVIMLGISGSLQQSLIDAGYSIEQIVGMLDSLKSSHQQSIDEITKKNAELEESYANGEISNEEYTQAIMSNYSELAELTGRTDEYADAVSKVSDAIKGVDFSDFINADNTVNTEKLANEFYKLSETVGQAKESIYLSSDSLVSALEDYQEEAVRMKNSEAVNLIGNIISDEANNVNSAALEVDESLKEYATTVQVGLLERIPAVVDQAVKDYENTSPIYRFFHSQDEYVQTALNEYQTNVIEPTENELESMFGEVGINVSTKASGIAKDMVDSIFDLEEYTGDVDVYTESYTLNEKYREILDGSMDGLYEKVKEDGGYLVDGLGEGMEEGAGALRGAANIVMNQVEQYLREAGKIHSPSERTKPIGMYLLQGIVEGFSDSDSEWFQIIGKWANDTYNSLSQSITKLVSDAGKWFGEMPKKIAASFTTMLADARRWGSQFMQQGSSSAQGFKNLLIGGMSSVPGELFGIGQNIVLGLWNGISNLGSWLSRQIGSFCDSILGFFRKGFDEHSPSREAYEIGDLFTQGLANGMTERFGDIFDDVIHFADRISNVHIDVPALNMSVPKIDDYIPQYSQTDARNLQRTMRMEYDVQMAQQAYDLQQQNQLLAEQNQLLRAILEKPALQDQDIFRASQRGQSMFNARTGRTGWAGVD